MTLVLRYIARSDRGLVRANNEDSVYAGARLLALADGMGGHAAGEVASQLMIAALAHLDDDEPGEGLLDKLEQATRDGNDAIARHVEKDLGTMAMPRVPVSPVPFTVAEYFPTPGVSPFHDPRQHAISLAYVVPIDGETAPQEDALELSWFGVDELLGDSSPLDEMDGGRDLLVRRALAYMGAA